MDLLAEIQAKARSLDGHPSQEGITAALRHVEIAERWFKRGREEQNEDMFNDVIYRTNQAFEGMLKEAYKILTGENSKSLSSYQIEKHLLEKDIFTPRVLELFKNYRQEWRNPSTHDHGLFFTEQEALLAIVRVSAFAAILLDQVIEAVYFHRERKDMVQRKEQIKYDISKRGVYSLIDDVLEILQLFSMDVIQREFEINIASLREVELLGVLSGFIESLDPSIRIQREPILSNDTHLRPDFILEKEGDRVLLEIKHAGYRNIDQGKLQLNRYLSASDIEHGILFIPPVNETQEATVKSEELNLAGRTAHLHIVVPS